jgi:hypothetical protein
MALNGALTLAAGGLLQLRGDGNVGGAGLTLAQSVTNLGTIELTDIDGGFGATLTVPSGGVLTNGSAGVIQVSTGANGPRTISGAVVNNGTVSLANGITQFAFNGSFASGATGKVLFSIGGANSGQFSRISGSAAWTLDGTLQLLQASGFNPSSGATFDLISFGTVSGNFTATEMVGFKLGTDATSNAAGNAVRATFGVSANLVTWNGSDGNWNVGSNWSTGNVPGSISLVAINSGVVHVTAGVSAAQIDVAVGATISIEGNGTFGTPTLTVGSGFTNLGLIELTSTSGFGAVLALSGGTLANGAGGVIRSSVISGAVGTRQIAASVTNLGTIEAQESLSIANSGRTLASAGGLLTVNAGRVMTVTGGTVELGSASLGGTGAVALSGTVTLQLPQALTLGAGGPQLTLPGSVTMTGAGSLTVGSGQMLELSGDTVEVPLTVEGMARVTGGATISGALSVPAGGTVRVEGNGTFGTPTLTVGSGFTNLGLIELTSTSGFGAVLALSGGTLANGAGGVIRSSVISGAVGARQINAAVTNLGTIDFAGTAFSLLTISGSLTQQSSSKMGPRLGGSSVGQFDRVSVIGTATLGGSLNLVQSGGFIPADGATFDLLTANSIAGQFAATTTSGFTGIAAQSSIVAQTVRAAITVTSGAVFWDGGGDGSNWTDANNWSTNTLPTAADDIAIPATGNPIVVLAGVNVTVKTLFVAGTLRLRNTTLTTTGGLTIDSTGTLAAFSLVADPDSGTLVSIVGPVTTVGVTSPVPAQSRVVIDTGPVSVELRFSEGFMNNGVIEFANSSSSHSDTIHVVSGVLNNASGATIRSSGDHVLQAGVTNRSSVVTSGTGAKLTIRPGVPGQTFIQDSGEIMPGAGGSITFEDTGLLYNHGAVGSRVTWTRGTLNLINNFSPAVLARRPRRIQRRRDRRRRGARGSSRRALDVFRHDPEHAVHPGWFHHRVRLRHDDALQRCGNVRCRLLAHHRFRFVRDPARRSDHGEWFHEQRHDQLQRDEWFHGFAHDDLRRADQRRRPHDLLGGRPRSQRRGGESRHGQRERCEWEDEHLRRVHQLRHAHDHRRRRGAVHRRQLHARGRRVVGAAFLV